MDLRGQDVSAKVEDDGTLLNFASEEVESSSDNSFDYSDYYDYFNIEQKRRKRRWVTGFFLASYLLLKIPAACHR